MDLVQLQEFFDYKNRLMYDLLTNEQIVRIIDPAIDNIEHAFERLAYKRVFPFDYVPETIEDAGTYICFDVDVQKVYNDTFLEPTIYIWLFSHKSLLRMPEGGIRTDNLCAKISEALNGNRHYGLGKLELYSVKRYTPMADYQGKIMMFVAKDFNMPSPSKHQVPANRKKW